MRLNLESKNGAAGEVIQRDKSSTVKLHRAFRHELCLISIKYMQCLSLYIKLQCCSSHK